MPDVLQPSPIAAAAPPCLMPPIPCSSCRLGGSLQPGHLVILVIVDPIELRMLETKTKPPHVEPAASWATGSVADEKSAEALAELLDDVLARQIQLQQEPDVACWDALLSEDIWSKFEDDLNIYIPEECDHDTMDRLLSDAVFEMMQQKKPERPERSEISKQDCMWNANALTTTADEPPALAELLPSGSSILPLVPPAAVTPPGVAEKSPVARPSPAVAPGRSLLLKSVVQPVPAASTTGATAAAPAPVVSSPDSPPISDDEDISEATAATLTKFLSDNIDGFCEKYEEDEDSDFCEYIWEDGGLLADPDDPPPQPTPASKPHFDLANDHSYHKDKNASMRIASLGIETPSDSEEEIDVVSIGEKNRMGHMLPTNPSSQYQEHLERTVQSAITQKRVVSGAKRLPPGRRYASLEKKPEARGLKRARSGHFGSRAPVGHPVKRRTAHPSNSSDSEPELEKRSLHNNMERQRRIDLRNAFEHLRCQVPRLKQMERVAKVQILQDARDFCLYLTNQNRGLERKLVEHRRKQERLRMKLSKLRRNLAAAR